MVPLASELESPALEQIFGTTVSCKCCFPHGSSSTPRASVGGAHVVPPPLRDFSSQSPCPLSMAAYPYGRRHVQPMPNHNPHPRGAWVFLPPLSARHAYHLLVIQYRQRRARHQISQPSRSALAFLRSRLPFRRPRNSLFFSFRTFRSSPAHASTATSLDSSTFVSGSGSGSGSLGRLSCTNLCQRTSSQILPPPPFLSLSAFS